MRRALRKPVSIFTSLCMLFAVTGGIVGLTAVSASAAPSLDSSFEGLRLNLDGVDPLNYGDDATPDPHIAVGPDRVVQYVNDAIGVFNKSGTLLNAVETADFFLATPGGTSCSAGDSNNFEGADVIYDSVSDRWIVAVTSTTNIDEHPYDPYYECIATSKTGNPMGDYYFNAVPLTSGGELYLLDEKLGFWSTADGPSSSTLWIGAAQYCDDCPGSGNVDNFIGATNGDWIDDYLGERIWAINVSDLESGSHVRYATTNGTGNLLGQTFQGPGVGGSDPIADTIKPASMNVAAGIPPSGRNEIFTGSDYPVGGTKQEIWRASVNWATSAITLTANTATTITTSFNFNYNTNFDSWVNEPSPGNVLNSGYDYTIGKLQYSKVGASESLWLTQGAWSSSGAPNSGVGSIMYRQWSLSGNNAPAASQASGMAGYSGNPTDTTVNRWIPAGAVDSLGNFGVGYNVSSSSVNPGLRFTGRETGDTAGSLQAESTLQNGSGYQVGTVDGEPFTGWGGTAGGGADMVLDPDGCTFWQTGEYLSSSPALPTDYDSDTWNTKIGSSHFASCTPASLATSITAVGGTGPAGGSATLTAKLRGSGTGSGVYGRTVSFKLNGSSVGSAVTNNDGVATLTGVSLAGAPYNTAGTYAGDVEATFSAAGPYAGSTNTGDLLAAGSTSQSINFSNPGTQTYGAADFAPGATADSSLPVSYTASGDCSIVAGNVHLKRGGSCTVTASQAGDATYAAATPVSQTFSISKASQTITFASLTGSLTTVITSNTSANGNVYVNNATSDSNLPVVLSDNGVCALSGLNHVYATHVGTCTITASQPGDDSYNAATPVARNSSTTIKGAQTAAQIPTNATRRIDQADNQWYAGFNINLVARYRLTPTFTVGNAGPFAVSASSGTGTVATLTLPSGHNIQVGTHITVTGAGAYNVTNVPVTAVAATTVSYASAATGAGGAGGTVTQSLPVCTGAIDPDTNTVLVTTLHTGSCTATVSHPGNADYNAGTLTSFNKGIQKGNQGSQVFSPVSGTIKPANASFSVTSTLTPASPDFTQAEFDAAGLTPVVTVSSGPCTVGSPVAGTDSTTVTVTPTGAGNCILSSSNAGNDDWAARTAQTSTYVIQLAPQTINVTGTWATDTHTFNDPDFSVSATATSGLPVSFSSDTPAKCTIVAGPKVHIVAAGTCTVRMQQSGNAFYSAAPDVTRTFVIAQGGNVINFPPFTGTHTYGDPNITISATAPGTSPPGSAGPVVFTSLTPGVCTIVNTNKVHIVGGGTCTVEANQGGNDNYDPADPVDRSFFVNARATVTKIQSIVPKKVFGSGMVTYTAKVKGNGPPAVGLTVQFKADGTTVIGSAVTNANGIATLTVSNSLAVGSHQIRAITMANANFASSVSNASTLKVKP